ncbi:MAG: hypothetical protein H6772_02365 [Pseudomonadales bacterium]|nr:hypothetical protein [Pseudomonadales bacterium]
MTKIKTETGILPHTLLVPNPEIESLSIHEKNLRQNFPNFERVSNDYLVNELKMGNQFAEIMDELGKMKRRFGICGIISGTSLALLTSPDFYNNRFNFSPKEYKRMFDENIKKGTKKPFDLFAEQYLLQEFSVPVLPPIMSAEGLNKILFNLKSNQGLHTCVLCEYEEEKGTHTHFLAIKKIDQKKLLVVGDLSPFGLNCWGIIVPVEDYAEALTKVIGASSTTTVSDAIIQTNIKFGDGLDNSNIFDKNAYIWTFEN